MLDKIKSRAKETANKMTEVAGIATKKTKNAASLSVESVSKTTHCAATQAAMMLEHSASRATTKISETAASAASAVTSGKKTTTEILEKHWPVMEKVILNGLIGIAEEKLQDEKFLTEALESIYELFPAPFRIVISRNAYLNFILKRKAPLLVSIEKYKERRLIE